MSDILTVSRRTALSGAAVLAAGLAAGCSDTTPTDGGSAATGQVLRMGVPTDVEFATIQRFQAPNQPVRRLVFDNLVDKLPDGSYVPALAEKFAWNEDNTVLTLNLHSGVTFHTGREFGAADVLANLEIATADGAGVQVASLLKRAARVEQTGDLEVTISFDQPFPSYLDALAVLAIVDPETQDGLADTSQVIGTGPFMVTDQVAGSSISLARNDSYWKADRPNLDGVEITVIGETQAMLAAMRSGSLDLAQRMLARDAAALRDEGSYGVDQTEGFEVYLGMNAAVAPLNDTTFRQAIAHALDRDRIAEQVYQGYAIPSCVPWSASTPGVSDDQVNRYSYDLQRAKQLIKESGHEGATVALTSYAADPAYSAIVDIVQFGLTEAGLEVKVDAVESSVFTKQLQTATMPGLWVTAVALTTLGPATALVTANPLTPNKNSSNWDSNEYADLVEQVVAAPDAEALATATTAVTEHLLAQCFHASLVQAQTPWAMRQEVRDVTADLTLAMDLTETTIGDTE